MSYRSHGRTYQVKVEDESPQDLESASLFKVGVNGIQPIQVEITLDDKPTVMEVNTGASVSLMSEAQFFDLFPNASLLSSRIQLKTYTSESVAVVGKITLQVKYQSQVKSLLLVVVKGSGPALLGRNWLQEIWLNWHQIVYTVTGSDNKGLQDVLSKYPSVFEPGLDTYTVSQAHLSVKENATPIFHRPRSIPFAIRKAVEGELTSLVEAGIPEKVDHSEWASPIVPVPKRDSCFRICGDYKVTINPHLEIDQHPLPKPEKLFSALTGGKQFTKLDLAQAYQQILLDESSKRLVTINTHLGLFRYTRLPFGIASAPALFQHTMDALLQGLPHVICYTDDILITGATQEEHLHNLSEVLQQLQSGGLRVKLSKCQFLQDSMEYLGHRIDSEGIHATPEKLDAIANAPPPSNVQELRSFFRHG